MNSVKERIESNQNRVAAIKQILTEALAVGNYEQSAAALIELKQIYAAIDADAALIRNEKP